MPSVMDERSRASSRLQPWQYQRSIASSWCRRVGPARALRACARRYGTPCAGEVGLELGVVRVRHVVRVFLEPVASTALRVSAARYSSIGTSDDVRRLGERGLQASDVPVDQRVVQDVAVDLGERRVAVGEPPQQDHELQQIGVRLLPERLLATSRTGCSAAWRSRRPPRTDRDRCAAGCSRRRCRARSRRSRRRARALAGWRAPAGRSRPSPPSPGRRPCGRHRRLRQRRSWSTYGYMQADVLPVPTAPRIMTPV